MASFKAAVTSAHVAVFTTDLRVLAALPPDLIPKFLHNVIDEICGRTPLYERYQEVLKCRIQDIIRLKNAYKLFISQAVGRGLKAEDVSHDLNNASLPPQVVSEVVSLLFSRHEEVRQSQAGRVSCAPFLQDFDWKVSLTMASDKCATLHAPVCSWYLQVATPKTDAQKEAEEEKNLALQNVQVEMTTQDLTKFVAQLEALAASMRSVTP